MSPELEGRADAPRTDGSSMSSLLSILSIAAAMIAVPACAAGFRRALPSRSGAPRVLEPVRFGRSRKTRFAGPHAVRAHRRLITGFFGAVLGINILAAAAALLGTGAGLISGALTFVLPTLLVSLHAARRSRRG